jgi:hypothetical protein
LKYYYFHNKLIKIKLWIDGVAGSSDNTNNYCLHNSDAQVAATADNIDLLDTFSESGESDNDKEEEPFTEIMDVNMISLFLYKLWCKSLSQCVHCYKRTRFSLLRKVTKKILVLSFLSLAYHLVVYLLSRPALRFGFRGSILGVLLSFC